MRQASKLEKSAARVWNVVNEGKSFTPVFVVAVFLFYQLITLQFQVIPFIMSIIWTLPLFIIMYIYDFPLKLRWFLWFPLVLYLGIFDHWNLGLSLFALAIYFFFTVFFWGTFYYHWRIGTPLDNYKRFWKMVMVHSDSTSGNAQEQIPKFLLLLTVMQGAYERVGFPMSEVTPYLLFVVGFGIYTFLIHRSMFDWRPAEPEQFTEEPLSDKALAQRVVMVVIDGCRKDRLAEADTPFIDWLKQTGTEYTSMETIYPARTVVCFSTIFTGAYPRDHGIKSNMVWKLGVRCQSVFDQLRKVGKQGRLLGIAHLVDAFGNDVDTVSAVMKNDQADGNIMARAKEIMLEKNPELMAIQLIAVDQTGHSRGPLNEEYKQKIEEADRHIEDFYHWLKDQGMLEDTVFMVCADHGQSDGIGGHAHLDEGERFVPFIMHGPQIKEGYQVHELRNLTSITPTFCYLLGAPYPDHSRGPVLTEAIKEFQR